MGNSGGDGGRGGVVITGVAVRPPGAVMKDKDDLTLDLLNLLKPRNAEGPATPIDVAYECSCMTPGCHAVAGFDPFDLNTETIDANFGEDCWEGGNPVEPREKKRRVTWHWVLKRSIARPTAVPPMPGVVPTRPSNKRTRLN